MTQPADPKVHDLIVGDHDVTMIQYAHDWDSAGCGVPAALDIEIINKDFDGKVLWKWSSKGHFKHRISAFRPMQACMSRLRAREAKGLRLAAQLLHLDRPAVR